MSFVSKTDLFYSCYVLGLVGLSHTPIPQLPSEVITLIFSYLKASDLARCSMVNRDWKVCARYNKIWRGLCLSEGLSPPRSCLDHFAYYKKFHSKCLTKKSFKKKTQRNEELVTFLEGWGPPHYTWHDRQIGLASFKEQNVKLWDVESGKCLRTIPEYSPNIDFDAHSLITKANGEILVFKEWRKFEDDFTPVEYKTEISSHGLFALFERSIYIESSNDVLGLDRETMKIDKSLSLNGLVTSFDYFASTLAIGGADGSVILWDVKMRTPFFQFLPKNEGYLNRVSIQGNLVLSVHSSNIKIWDIRNPKGLLMHYTTSRACLAALQGPILAIAEGNFEISKKSLATRCTVKLWDTQANSHTITLLNHKLKKRNFPYDTLNQNYPWALRWEDSSLFFFQKNGYLYTWTL